MKLLIPKFWHEKNWLSKLLSPLGFIYNNISSKLRYVDTKNIYISKAKIITIGNITMGGAGKTPVSISIAKIIQNHSKHKIVILTRGYKGNLTGPIMVNQTHNINDIGDEALLISRQLPTCVSKDRLKGIKFLEEAGYDIIITDDGMQDQRFKKDLTFMIIDSYFGFGNGLIFPAGPLREKIESGIKKSDFIVVIGDKEINLDVPILKANIVSKISLDQQKFIAFAGIGNPEKFFHSVIEAEGEIIKKFAFGDHHQYTNKELVDLIDLAISHQVKLITTEKDFTRIDDKFKSDIHTLPITIVWKKEEQLIERLLNL